MPLYEFVCGDCRKIYNVLVGMTASGDTTRCPNCGSESGKRRVSRFVHTAPAANAAELLVSGDVSGSDDPRVMEQWAKDIAKETGEELGAEFHNYIQDVASEG